MLVTLGVEFRTTRHIAAGDFSNLAPARSSSDRKTSSVGRASNSRARPIAAACARMASPAQSRRPCWSCEYRPIRRIGRKSSEGKGTIRSSFVLMPRTRQRAAGLDHLLREDRGPHHRARDFDVGLGPEQAVSSLRNAGAVVNPRLVITQKTRNCQYVLTANPLPHRDFSDLSIYIDIYILTLRFRGPIAPTALCRALQHIVVGIGFRPRNGRLSAQLHQAIRGREQAPLSRVALDQPSEFSVWPGSAP